MKAMVEAGIPVMAHIGRTQSEHALGGYRFQGRGDHGRRLIDDAVALADAACLQPSVELKDEPNGSDAHMRLKDAIFL